MGANQSNRTIQAQGNLEEEKDDLQGVVTKIEDIKINSELIKR